jgi:hypothetical protein
LYAPTVMPKNRRMEESEAGGSRRGLAGRRPNGSRTAGVSGHTEIENTNVRDIWWRLCSRSPRALTARSAFGQPESLGLLDKWSRGCPLFLCFEGLATGRPERGSKDGAARQIFFDSSILRIFVFAVGPCGATSAAPPRSFGSAGIRGRPVLAVARRAHYTSEGGFTFRRTSSSLRDLRFLVAAFRVFVPPSLSGPDKEQCS